LASSDGLTELIMDETMQSPHTNDARIHWRRWEPRARWGAALVIVGLVLIKWMNIIRSPRGDFLNHYQFGQRFLSGEFIYSQGLNIPYPPFWAMAHAPLTFMSVGWAQSLVFLLGPLSLIAVIGIVRSLSRSSDDESLLWWWGAVLTIFVSSRYILRDFDEAGPNLTLLALAWGGIWFWSRRHEVIGSLSLGLAIALKCTSAIFILYFLWKREWKMAAYSIAASLLLTLSPILFMGPARYSEHMRVWLTNLQGASGIHDPTRGLLGDEPVANKSLRPAMGRFLVHLPEGHLARYDHPAYIDFLNLSPDLAHRVTQVGIVSLVMLVFWNIRGKVSDRRSINVAYECAALSVLALLVSPITWGQHCVATVPAVLLFFHRWLSGHSMGRGVIAWSMSYAIIVMLVNRTFFGKELSLVLETYHLVTWSLVILLGITLRLKRETSNEAVQETLRSISPKQSSLERVA